jgi:hypothetical protein
MLHLMRYGKLPESSVAAAHSMAPGRLHPNSFEWRKLIWLRVGDTCD